MIKIRIKNYDNEIDVRFPISENELYAKLAEIHAIEDRDAPQSDLLLQKLMAKAMTLPSL